MNEPRDVDMAPVAQGSGSLVGTEHLPAAPAPAGQLPTVVPHAVRGRRRWLRLLVLLGVVVVGAGGGAYWWLHRPLPLPAGIAYGNGRIEADPIDIATKFAGRIAELRVDEGAMVTAGQVVAVMDTRDMAASLKKSEAQLEQARKAIQEANANVDQTHTEVVLADQEIERARALLKNGFITKELFDQRQQKANSARAGELAAMARVRMTENRLNAAEQDVELYKVNIADNTLVAPRDGRIEYRIANIGEVLPAGGKVFTMLDIGYVYMDIYLPTMTAGQVKIGTRCPHRARRLSRPADSGESDVPRLAGAVHAQDGRDPDGTRQADVSRQGPNRSGTLACPRGCREDRAAGRGVRQVRCQDRLAGAPAREPVEVATAAARIVRLEGVSHRYRGVVALDGVTLDVPADRIIGLIGPDGVGKSSLLGLIAGAKRVQDGRVEVLGGDMANARHRGAICPRIAFMPQGLGKNLYPDLSVRENIDFFGRLFGHGRAERAARIAELLDSTGLAEFADRLAKQALRRDAAEARPVLRPDPRPGPADPRRAHDRRGSAVAAAVLAPHRSHARRAARA